MEFLRAKSHDPSSARDRPTAKGAISQPTPTPTSTVSSTSGEADTSVITGEEGWEGLCTQAMESQPSYAVAFEVRPICIALLLVVIWAHRVRNGRPLRLVFFSPPSCMLGISKFVLLIQCKVIEQMPVYNGCFHGNWYTDRFTV